MHSGKNLQIAGQSLTLQDVHASHMDDVLALHGKIFNSNAQRDWFEWKYVEGHGDGVGIWNADQALIAFCGGVPRQFSLQGQVADFLQIGDLMVSPQWRGVMTRKNPFWYACEHFYRTRLGRERPFKVGFGFTHERSHRLHIKLGLSWDGGSVQHLQWPTKQSKHPAHRQWLWKTVPLAHDSAQFHSIIDRAWQAMQDEALGFTIGVRDADYFAWRFTQRPDKRYRLFTLRRAWSAHPLGVLVMSQPTHPTEPAQWLDWVGPVRHLDQACLAALQVAVCDGADTMTAWASPAVAALLSVTQPALLGSAAELCILTPSDLDPEQLPGLNMWLMAGDTEYM